jgi:hypothetical protein
MAAPTGTQQESPTTAVPLKSLIKDHVSNRKQSASDLRGSAIRNDVEANEDDSTSYPSGFQFVWITLSLMLVVFLVGLVKLRGSLAKAKQFGHLGLTCDVRIQRFWLPRFPRSPMNFIQSTTSGGMMLHCKIPMPLFRHLSGLTVSALISRMGSSMSQLSQGKLFNNYPVKWVFLVNMIFFEVGCLVTATAPSSKAFIVGRALSGIGCAGVSQGCMVYVPFQPFVHL